jgi:glycosyltransferase involved in cell wall biosynthesis
MRVLVVGGHAPSLLNFRGPLLKALVRRGHQVYACAPNASAELQERLRSIGVEYFHIPLRRASINVFHDFATVRALSEVINTFRPECVLAYTVKPVIYSSLAARFSGGPPVYGMISGLGYAFGGGSAKQQLVGYIVRSLYRYALRDSAGIFFQNADDREIFTAYGLLPPLVPVTLINGSGVDLAWYTPQSLPRAPVFLLIARLLTDKGIREYVEAARNVKRRFPHARFQLAGGFDPNPMSIQPAELREWEREGVIDYLGELDDVRPALGMARCYVLPSYREGTPRTVLEAMATGRPVITTDAPGCRETVIDGENGLLVPVRNALALQDAMETILERPDLVERMAQKGLERVREKYDVHKVNATMMEAMGL